MEDRDDEVGAAQWDSWDRVLAALAVARQQGTGPSRGWGDDTVAQLYRVAVELRDKLRYSQYRLRSVKGDLGAVQAAQRSERQEAVARLRGLEAELARLSGAVQSQGGAVAASEAAAVRLSAENAQLRRQLAAQQQQLHSAELERDTAVSQRDAALAELEQLAEVADEAEERAAHHEAKHEEAMGQLVANKGRLAGLSAMEGLYSAARDELGRLDKENLELKDMVAAAGAGAGAMQLGRSRILEALGIPDDTDVFVSVRGGASAGTSGRRATHTRSSSAPRARKASSGPVSPNSYGRGAFIPDMIPASADAYRSSRPTKGVTGSPMGGSMALVTDPVSEMAFLGPPSAAYPPDPENYTFYRVGGGYSPRVDPAQPTVPQPRASGWVPKDVVRLLQAFRHSYGLALEWRFFEPLILMVDEVYRGRAEGTLMAMRAAQRDKVKSIRRQLGSALGYPSVLASGKVTHLQRQLTSARRTLGEGDRRGEVALKQMAVKDYHLGHQLDRAVEENFALRRSLADLDELYSATQGAGGGQGQRHGHAQASARWAGRVVRQPGDGPGSGGGGGGSGASQRELETPTRSKGY